MKTQIIISLVLCLSFSLCTAQGDKSFINGMARLESNKFVLAEKSFDTAISNAYKADLSYFYRGVSRFSAGNYSGAREDFITAAQNNNNQAYFWLAKLYAEQNQPAQAVNSLSKFLSIADVPNPYNLFKDESLKKIYPSDAWQKFITSFQPTEIQNSIENADQLISKKQFEQAHNVIDKTLVSNQNSDILHAANAKIYASEGNYTLARFEMKKASDINPGKTDYLCDLGKYAAQLHEYDAAYTYLTRAEKASPERFDIKVILAKTCLLDNKSDEARSLTSGYLKYFPADTSVILLQAKANYNLQNYSEVLKTVNKLMKENPPRPDWFLLRGLTYFQTSTFKYAAYDLSMCLDLDPKNTQAYYYLGLSEIEKGNKELACYYLQKAYDLGESKAFETIQQNCNK